MALMYGTFGGPVEFFKLNFIFSILALLVLLIIPRLFFTHAQKLKQVKRIETFPLFYPLLMKNGIIYLSIGM
jgi:hypothetical protein